MWEESTYLPFWASLHAPPQQVVLLLQRHIKSLFCPINAPPMSLDPHLKPTFLLGMGEGSKMSKK